VFVNENEGGSMPRRAYRVRDVKILRERMKASKRVVSHTVRSLADQVGSNRGTIGALLSGEQETLSEELAEQIAFAFGVPKEDLFVPSSFAFPNASDKDAPEAKGARDE
jgi:transcriptional regulator with XRE-family HTH domain